MKRRRLSRQESSRQTRRRIIEEATTLFATKGFAATTTLDIARKAGVSHGSVFAHFPSRGELVGHVVAEFGQKVSDLTHERARSGRGLRAVLEAHLAAVAENESLYARLVTEGALLPAQARLALIAINSAVSLHMAEAAAGVVPPHLLFNTWIGLVHYYLANRDLFAPGGSVIERHGVELVNHYIGLVGPQGGSE
jgi:AcrR family transcriptional regulator